MMDYRCLATHPHLQSTKPIWHAESIVIEDGKLLKTPIVSLGLRPPSRLTPERMRVKRAGIELPSAVRDGKYKPGIRTPDKV